MIISRSLKRKDAKKLEAIDNLIYRNEMEQALRESLEFTRKRPKLIEGWRQLFAIVTALDRKTQMWTTIHQLCQLDPYEENYRYNLAILSVQIGSLFLALESVQIYLKRFPDGLNFEKIVELKQELDRGFQELIASGEIKPDVSVRDMALFEKGNFLISKGEHTEGRKFSRQAAKRMPGNPSPLNNIALSYVLEGNLSKAVQLIDDVLNEYPDHIFTRGLKVQCLVQLGQADEASAILDDLWQATSQNSEYLIKIMEACAFAHEHEKLLAVHERVVQLLDGDEQVMPMMMFHLAGVAHAFLGNTKQAQQLWSKALSKAPREPLVVRNMQHSDEHGPWYFSLPYWMSERWIEAMQNLAKQSDKRGDSISQQDYERLFKKTPGLKTSIALQLGRGDPQGLEIALYVAASYPLPGLDAFALSQRGTDEQRFRAANLANDYGMLSRAEPVVMFVKGEPLEVMLYQFTVDEELRTYDPPLSEEAHQHLRNAYGAMPDDPKTTLHEVETGLELVPDAPVFLNYKANALNQLGRHDEANAISRELADRNPDYLFARTAMAQLCVREDKLDEAQEWLQPLLDRKHFHISEFRALAHAYIDYWIGRGEPGGVKYWIQMWDQMDPETLPDSWRKIADVTDALEKIKQLARDQ